MSKPISRRAVIAGTVVALLLMSGGYVIATTLSGISPTQTSQNAGSITAPTNTIFSSNNVSSINIQLIEGEAVDCGLSADWSSTVGANASVFMDGTAACTNSTQEWFEELSWVGVNVPGVGQNDTFFITVSTAGPTAYTYDHFNIRDITPSDGRFVGQLNVLLAAGSAIDGGLPNAYTGISIAVSGT
jgi:hypothetical protein